MRSWKTLQAPLLCLLLAGCSRGSPDDLPVPGDMAPGDEPAGTGRCEADPVVHPEAAPDPGTAPDDLAFTPITGLVPGPGLGQAETREVFTSAAAFERYFGVPAPGVDFDKRWVLFYSPGSKATDGYVPSVTRLRVVDGEVRVDTALESPGPSCPIKNESTRPVVLVAFDRPALSTCRATYHHAATTRACVPAEPGPACDGLLTDRGIDDLVTGRPPAMITSYSYEAVFAPKSVSLGNYRTGRWSRVCKSETECDPWAEVMLTGDYYLGQAYYYRDGMSQMLILVSTLYPYQFNIGGGMYKSCYRLADGDDDLVKKMTGETVATITLAEHSGCVQGGTTGNSDNFRLGPLTGRLADRCFRLTDRKRETLGVSSFRETLTAVTGSW